MSETDDWVVVGSGETPSGNRWRLRIRAQTPGRISVDLQTLADPARFELLDRLGTGYGGAPLPPDRLIKLSAMARGEDEQSIIGEVAPVVAQVRVRLDHGRGLHAKIIRTHVVEHDYFLAFGPEDAEVTAVTALDGQGRVLGEETRSEESIRASQEFRRKLRRRTSRQSCA